MENENILTQIQSLNCEEQLGLMQLVFEIASLRSNMFIPTQQSVPLIEKLTKMVIAIEDSQVERGVISSIDRVTIPVNSIEEEDV